MIPPAANFPKFISSFGQPRKRTVSIGPQSEADAREMLAQREILRRQSMNSLRSKSYTGDIAASSSAVATPLATPLDVPGTHENEKMLGHDLNSSHSPYQSDSENDRAVLEGIERPRVRYDVEVVTKLVVYSGIAWLSIEGNPMLFWYLGLGLL